jgi:hypothetical protein
LCRRPPSGPISTNSLAPTSWKNPGLHGEDAIDRHRSHHGSSLNPSASVGTRQPFGFGHPAFGGDRCRAERSGGRAHRFRGVRGQPRGAGGFGTRHRGSRRARPCRPSKSKRCGRLRRKRSRPSSRTWLRRMPLQIPSTSTSGMLNVTSLCFRVRSLARRRRSKPSLRRLLQHRRPLRMLRRRLSSTPGTPCRPCRLS